MSEEAEKIIQIIKQGSLPSLTINNDKGTQSSRRGIDHTTFGLQSLDENAQRSSTSMRKENESMVCTVNELSNYLGERARKCIREGSRFPDCDFAVIDSENANKSFDELRDDNYGWYGIKAVDTGFDSADLILFSDYYGGGCASFCSIWEELWYYQDASEAIEKTILDTLRCSDVVMGDSMLIVDFI